MAKYFKWLWVKHIVIQYWGLDVIYEFWGGVLMHKLFIFPNQNVRFADLHPNRLKTENMLKGVIKDAQ
jgi:hypothetical protein